MATLTFLKNDGIFIYEDYKKGRAALRVKELDGTNPTQNIRRNNAGDVQAVLVSKDWYDARIAAYAAGDSATFAEVQETVDDDFMGSNLSTMIDLIRANVQTVGLAARVAAEGLSNEAFKTYAIIELKEFYQDNSDAVPFEDSQRVGGDVKAYLIHPTLQASLAATPVATTYSGTGDGTLDLAYLKPGGAVTETITVTATSATSFDVVGSVTGAIGTLTVGELFDSPQIQLLISAGGTPFVATDEFTIDSVAADF